MASAGALCVTSRSEYPGRTASPATDAPCWPGPDSTIAAPPAHEGSHWTQRAAGRSTAQRSRPTGGHSRTAERRPKPQTVGQSQPRGQRFREVAAALPYECERLPSATLPDPLASLVGTAIRDTASAVLEEVADALPEMTRTGRRASAPDVDQLHISDPPITESHKRPRLDHVVELPACPELRLPVHGSQDRVHTRSAERLRVALPRASFGRAPPSQGRSNPRNLVRWKIHAD